jgi:hypothetical protein
MLPDGSTGWAHFDRGQLVYGFPWDVTDSAQEWKQAPADQYGDDWDTANAFDSSQAPSGNSAWESGLRFTGSHPGQEPRYIGYDAAMNEISNEGFPIDASSMPIPAQCQMIKEPWSNISGDPNYLHGSGWPGGPNGSVSAVPGYAWGGIEGAIKDCYKQFWFTTAADSFVDNPIFSDQNGGLSPTNIENYFELLTMPEPGVTGSVRFWHYVDGSPYYKTISIPWTVLPNYYVTDLKPFGTSGTTTAQYGEGPYTGSVSFVLEPDPINSSNAGSITYQLWQMMNLPNTLSSNDYYSAPIGVCVDTQDSFATITKDSTFQPVPADENAGGTNEGIVLGGQNGVKPGTYTVTFTWSVPSSGFSGTSMPVGAGINDGYNDFMNQTTDIIPDDITNWYADSSEENLSDNFTIVQVPVTGAPQQQQSGGNQNSGSGGSSGGSSPGGNSPANPTGSPGDATLTFNAVNQANIKTMTGQQIGGTLQRGPNIALWTDTVTATLSAPEPPQPAQIPNNGQFVKFNDWAIMDATLNDIPAQNPDYAFGNPVEPVSDLPPMTLTPEGSGPATATAVTAGFEENWSEDGIGYTTSGPYGVKDVLTGQMMATASQSYTLSATYTVAYDYTYEYQELAGYDGNGNPIYQTVDATASGSGGPLTVTQDIWVCGTGAVPLTSAGQNYMVADTLNPQTHP